MKFIYFECQLFYLKPIYLSRATPGIEASYSYKLVKLLTAFIMLLSQATHCSNVYNAIDNCAEVTDL